MPAEDGHDQYVSAAMTAYDDNAFCKNCFIMSAHTGEARLLLFKNKSRRGLQSTTEEDIEEEEED